MSALGTVVGLVAELAVLELKALVRRGREAERAAKQWAETPAPVRACPRCREVSYTPGQTTCAKCGAPL
jgi:hypothetical protein